MIKNIVKRSRTILNLDQYNNPNYPDRVGAFEINCPYEEQNVLRCLIKVGFDKFKIPSFLLWAEPLILKTYQYQKTKINIEHSFAYITIRKGLKKQAEIDRWHVDGFSMRINHIPEQNYIWADKEPTLIAIKQIDLSKMDPFKENIHYRIEEKISDKHTRQLEEKTIYCIDPYVIHKRPVIKSLDRLFIRVSYTPIEIKDSGNTINPLLPTNHTRDGVSDFRDKLV